MPDDGTHVVRLSTADPELLVDLFGSELPREADEANIGDGVRLRVSDAQVEHGLIETTIIVNCLVTIATGVATNVLGDLLTEAIKNKRAKISLDGRELTASAPETRTNGTATA